MKTVLKRRVIEYEEKIPESLEGFERWDFTSGPVTNDDFKEFAKLFKKFVKKNLPNQAELVDFSVDYYDLHGFIQREQSNFVYFSTSDVRYFKNKWRNKILVRTASSAKDFTGGSNNYTNLENFKKNVKRLLER